MKKIKSMKRWAICQLNKREVAEYGFQFAVIHPDNVEILSSLTPADTDWECETLEAAISWIENYDNPVEFPESEMDEAFHEAAEAELDLFSYVPGKWIDTGFGHCSDRAYSYKVQSATTLEVVQWNFAHTNFVHVMRKADVAAQKLGGLCLVEIHVMNRDGSRDLDQAICSIHGI